MRVTAKVSADSIVKTKVKIEEKLKRVVGNATETTMETLARMTPTKDFPLWSGSYMASWRVYEGVNQGGYVRPPPFDSEEFVYVAGAYGNPLHLLGTGYQEYKPSKPYTVMLVVNNWKGDTDIDAAEIENIGSPSHQSPWKVAAHAHAQTIMQASKILKA